MELPLVSLNVMSGAGEVFAVVLRGVDIISEFRNEIQRRLKMGMRTDDLKVLRELHQLIGVGKASAGNTSVKLRPENFGGGKSFKEEKYVVEVFPNQDDTLFKLLRDKFGERFGLKAKFQYPHPTMTATLVWYSTEESGVVPDKHGNFQATLTYEECTPCPKLETSDLGFLRGTLSLSLCFRTDASKRNLTDQCAINQKMLEMELGTDTVIVAESGKEFKCHKSFLFAHSPVLQAMLLSGMEESQTSRIQVPDLAEEVVEAFLQYLYTKDTSKVTGNCELCFGLLYAAHKYQVECLEARAMELLQDLKKEDFRVDIALKLFVFLGNIPGSEELKKKTAAVMKQEFDALAGLAEYEDLLRKNLEGTKELIKCFARS